MRKYHLLLAEWRLSQCLTEGRFYKLCAIWADKDSDLLSAFPFLDQPGEAEAGDLDDFGDLDESSNFESVAAYMGAK